MLAEFAAAPRKLKDARPPKEVADDIAAQLHAWCRKRFLARTPWPQLQHLPRYLKAIAMRLDKLRADPARDAQRLAELRPLEQRCLAPRGRAARARAMRGWTNSAGCSRSCASSLFAQELRTPQPVSAKRLDKAWAQGFA